MRQIWRRYVKRFVSLSRDRQTHAHFALYIRLIIVHLHNICLMSPSGCFLVIEMKRIEILTIFFSYLLSENQINVRPCLWITRQMAVDHQWSEDHRLRTAALHSPWLTLWNPRSCFPYTSGSQPFQAHRPIHKFLFHSRTTAEHSSPKWYFLWFSTAKFSFFRRYFFGYLVIYV